jgi:hypothetical protein
MCVGFGPENPYKRFYFKHGAVPINPHWAMWPDVSLLVPDPAPPDPAAP